MKKAILLAVVSALLITPAAAMAKGTPGGHSAPKVMYVFKGTLSNYTAYDSGTQTPGSITIVVTSANKHGKSLKGQTLTFPVGATTTISLENGVTAIANGDTGIVKIKAAKKIAPADLASTLQATTASQVVDQGA